MCIMSNDVFLTKFDGYFQCERCKPLYNNKPFLPGDLVNDNNCVFCECYNHASSCQYSATHDNFPNNRNLGGGGVCINCQDNTEGRYCDKCKAMYYRAAGMSLYDASMCQPCDCNPSGIKGNNMECNTVGYCRTANSGFIFIFSHPFKFCSSLIAVYSKRQIFISLSISVSVCLSLFLSLFLSRS